MARGGELIAAIYDTIADPSGWGAAVQRIVRATNSCSGALIADRGCAANMTVLCNVDPFYADAYARTYRKINPLAPVTAATLVAGKVQGDSHITKTDSFRASAFYNEFCRPQGWADFVEIGVLRAPNKYAVLVLTRSPDAIWVEPPEWHLLETLAPHLQRVASVHELIAGATAATQSLGAAVAAAGFAVFLLTEDCLVLFANPKAEDLVRRRAGLRYEGRRLMAATPALSQCLHALARHGTRPVQSEGDIGGTLELPRGENRSPLLAHVIPLVAKRTSAVFDIDRPAVAVFVVDPIAELSAQLRRFAIRFGLTPTESRVLGEVIGGNGLPAAAARLKLSGETTRSHTKRIFQKTGTGRQTELIRRFFETGLTGSLPGV